jgi:hypothetical protein
MERMPRPPSLAGSEISWEGLSEVLSLVSCACAWSLELWEVEFSEIGPGKGDLPSSRFVWSTRGGSKCSDGPGMLG